MSYSAPICFEHDSIIIPVIITCKRTKVKELSIFALSPQISALLLQTFTVNANQNR